MIMESTSPETKQLNTEKKGTTLNHHCVIGSEALPSDGDYRQVRYHA